MLGETHPDTLVSLNLLATIYFYSERFDKAEELYSECLEKRKALLGENHPLSLATMDNLSRFHVCSAQICHSFLSSRNLRARNV